MAFQGGNWENYLEAFVEYFRIYRCADPDRFPKGDKRNLFVSTNFPPHFVDLTQLYMSLCSVLDPYSGEGLWVAYTVPSVCGQFSCHHHGEESVQWSSKEVQVDLEVGLQNDFISEFVHHFPPFV